MKGSPIGYINNGIVHVIGFHEKHKEGNRYVLHGFSKNGNN